MGKVFDGNNGGDNESGGLDEVSFWSGITGLANSISNLGDNISNRISSTFDTLIQPLSSILDLVNPLSDNFFLLKAFVPSDNFLENKNDELKTALFDKFPIINQITDVFDSFQSSDYSDSEWQGVKAEIPLLNNQEFVIIDPTFVNYIAPKIRFWFSGLIWFFLLLYTLRRVAVMANR